MEERFIRIEEIALVLGVNQFSIERWYKFKRENPDNEYAKILPEFTYQINSKNRKVRCWKASDIEALKKFQDNIVLGTKGFMGASKKEEKKNDSKKRKSNQK